MSRSTTSHPPCLLRWKRPICLPRTVQPLRICWWGRDDDLDYCEDNVFEDSFETSRNNNSNSLNSNVAKDSPIRNMIKSMSITEKDDKLVPKQLFNDGGPTSSKTVSSMRGRGYKKAGRPSNSTPVSRRARRPAVSNTENPSSPSSMLSQSIKRWFPATNVSQAKKQRSKSASD